MHRVRFAIVAVALGLVAASCGGDDGGASGQETGGTVTTGPSATEEPTATNTPDAEDNEHIRGLFGQWPNTDPASLTVDAEEILRVPGCPNGKDCIPALDVVGEVTIRGPRGGQALFEPVADAVMDARFPVATVTVNGQTRGFPLHIVMFHEIVNDTIGGVPVAVTFCPLCNTVLSFERTVDGEVLDFGVSGLLRFSDLVMFDRQTESWWQQATGESIVGVHAGTVLKGIATTTIAFEDFKATYPEADILTTDTGFPFPYGFSDYTGYDAPGSTPPLFRGEPDLRLEALERVVALRFNDAQLAVPFAALNEARTANVVVGGTPIVVFWAAGTVTPLGELYIPEADDIGAGAAYSAMVDGEVLEFEPGPEEGTFVDLGTGSVWEVTGLAVEGPLQGTQLTAVEHTTQFWFSWAAFFPDTEIWPAG